MVSKTGSGRARLFELAALELFRTLGNGDLELRQIFAAHLALLAGEAYGAAASDLNGDGQPDLVVSTPVGVTVLVNTSQPRGTR